MNSKPTDKLNYMLNRFSIKAERIQQGSQFSLLVHNDGGQTVNIDKSGAKSDAGNDASLRVVTP